MVQKNKQDIRCSFCGRPQSEVERIIYGRNAYICNECVEMCAELLGENAPAAEKKRPESRKYGENLTTPIQIKSYLDQFVCEKSPFGRSLQPLQKSPFPEKNKYSEKQHPSSRADRFGKNASCTDSGNIPQCSVQHCRCDDAHRGGIRR